MRLALFDFDGTLTTKDSLGEFIKFAVGTPMYYTKLALFSPILFLYKSKIMDNAYAKKLLFRLYFHNISEIDFKSIAQEYSQTKLYEILRKDLYEKFLEHTQNGDRVIIVSASMKCWLEEFAKVHKVELISTELAFKKGKFSGEFKTPNCHGEEKLRRVEEILSLKDYEEIFSYGDSSGDDAILRIAHHKYKLK